jgi:hypothetical protein
MPRISHSLKSGLEPLEWSRAWGLFLQTPAELKSCQLSLRPASIPSIQVDTLCQALDMRQQLHKRKDAT